MKRPRRQHFSRLERLEARLMLTAAFPFPQHAVYATDTISPNHRTQVEQDNDVRAYYDQWRDDYLVDAGVTGEGNPLYRVSFGNTNPGRTVSEGQGWGMVILATMAGHDAEAQTVFDGLWEFSREHPSNNDNRLMGWQVPVEPNINSSAFDGDAEIAYGLLLADRQWGSEGRIDYAAEAEIVMDAIMESTIGPTSRLPLLGDWVDPNGTPHNEHSIRTSDIMPAHFRAFATATGDPSWHDVVTNSQDVITTLQSDHSPATGLVPDFVVPTSSNDSTPRPADAFFLEGSFDGDYYYNAGRAPWRIGNDALLNNDAISRQQAQMISTWAEAAANGRPSEIRGGYHLDGTPVPGSDFFTTFFAAPLGVAAMTNPEQQNWLNDVYDSVYTRHEDYYEDTVTLLSLLTMTQNFWDPTNATGRGKPKSLFIGIDGMRSDAMVAANTPNLDRLADGSFANNVNQGATTLFGRSEDITVSGPNHATILTGVHRDKHGVVDNSFSGANFTDYPDYLTRLETDLPMLNTARLMTWTAGHNALPTSADYIADGSDVENATAAAEILAGTNAQYADDPDSIYLFLDDVDHAGHAHGFWPNQPDYLASIETVDRQIGQVLDALASRPGFAAEDWLIIVTSDHGGTMNGSHGANIPEVHTVPIIVSGQSVSPGELVEGAELVDIAPTILRHMGLAIPPEFDGNTIGHEVLPQPRIAEDLVVYLPFDGDYNDYSGSERINNGEVGGGTPTLQPSAGKFGGYVELDGSADFVTLGAPSDLNFGTDTDFTITLWVRTTSDQAGDSVLIGNKNWDSGFNQGWVLAYGNGGAGNDDIQANIGDASLRSDVDPSNSQILDTAANQWDFVAMTVDRSGQMRVFTDGGPNNGLLNFMNISGGESFLTTIGNVDTPNTMATNIGQDGTGNYNFGLIADIDDLGIWRRALSYEELNMIFREGQGAALADLLTNNPPVVQSITINHTPVDPPDLATPQPTSWREQRSEIRTVEVTFSEPVVASADDFVLLNLGVNAPAEADVQIALNDSQITSMGSVVTVQLDPGQVDDGVLSLRLLPTLTDLDGNPLDGNGDGQAGDEFTFSGNADNLFYQLTADFNGDLGVSIFDFATLSYWFGESVGIAPEYVDMNRDAGVSIFDFPALQLNFGAGIVWPGVARATESINSQPSPNSPLENQQVVTQLEQTLLPRKQRILLRDDHVRPRHASPSNITAKLRPTDEWKPLFDLLANEAHE